MNVVTNLEEAYESKGKTYNLALRKALLFL